MSILSVMQLQMPKTYHRKTERANWSPYAMLAAMKDVRQKKLSLYQST